MVPVLFPGVPGGVELLVILLIALVLLGLPLFLLVVGGFGFWQLSRDGDERDDETVEELRQRVDELESQFTDPGESADDGPSEPSDDVDPDTEPAEHGDRRERAGE